MIKIYYAVIIISKRKEIKALKADLNKKDYNMKNLVNSIRISVIKYNWDWKMVKYITS